MIWSIEAQCLPMALRLPLQTIGTLGTSLWQLQVALRPYTSRKGSGRRVIGRIFSMDEKRAVFFRRVTVNNIGTNRTNRAGLAMSVVGGKAENICSVRVFRLLTPERTSTQSRPVWPIGIPRLSFDHLVGAREQHRGHLRAECLRGLQIDHQLELDERPSDRHRRIIGSPSTLPKRPKTAGKKRNFASLVEISRSDQ